MITPWGNPTTEINRYSAVLGAWYRKAKGLHANIDAQVGSADNWIYRTDPTSFFNVKGNISYAPQPWLMLGGNLDFPARQEQRSPTSTSTSTITSPWSTPPITPGKRWGLDLAYNFDAIQQNIILCFQGQLAPPGSTPCLGDNTLLQTYGIYQTHTQYGYFALTLTPVERVTIRLGYNIVDNQGTTTSFNTLLPLGPLSSTYQSPLGSGGCQRLQERHLQGRLELLPVRRRLPSSGPPPRAISTPITRLWR